MRTPWVLRRMLVGSTDHLVALGELTLDFSAADEALAQYVGSFLRIATGHQFDDIEYRLQEWNFSGKIKALRMLVGHCSDVYRVDKDRLMNLLDTLSQMADHRNDIVHGWVEWDSKRHRPVFRTFKKKHSRSAEAAAIRKLCNRLRTWLDDFRDEVIKFLEQVERNTGTQ